MGHGFIFSRSKYFISEMHKKVGTPPNTDKCQAGSRRQMELHLTCVCVHVLREVCVAGLIALCLFALSCFANFDLSPTALLLFVSPASLFETVRRIMGSYLQVSFFKKNLSFWISLFLPLQFQDDELIVNGQDDDGHEEDEEREEAAPPLSAQQFNIPQAIRYDSTLTLSLFLSRKKGLSKSVPPTQ